jgi:hypothetical protein
VNRVPPEPHGPLPARQARSCAHDDSSTSPNPQTSQPHNPFIQIDITFTLRHRLVWLLAGMAIGAFHLPDGLLEKVTLIFRALLPG